MSATLLEPPRLRRAWYVACWSHELSQAPLARQLWAEGLVLFRDEQGQAHALLDRCPHRVVPLSQGCVRGGHLQCAYHGWRFDGQGRCRHIPGLVGEADTAPRRTPAFPTREQQGVIWVWASPAHPPDREPYTFPHADRAGYLTVRQEVRAEASIHMVAENALDVPHTAFLHGGWFRKDGERSPIECVVQRFADHVVCEYIGEARPEGLAGRLLSPSGGTVTHFDRFFLPSVLEVEYSIGEENHIIVSGAMTPVDDYDTRLFAIVSVRTRVPGWLLRPVVTPVALQIFKQDARLLKIQTDTMMRAGQAHYVSTELDLLGPHILKLLQRAARGDHLDPTDPPTVRRVTMMV